MHMFEGRVYHDDRLFILDLSPAKKGAASVWAVTTRRESSAPCARAGWGMIGERNHVAIC